MTHMTIGRLRHLISTAALNPESELWSELPTGGKVLALNWYIEKDSEGKTRVVLACQDEEEQ